MTIAWFKSFILVFICECRVENQCTIPSFARNRPLVLFLLSRAPLDNSISWRLTLVKYVCIPWSSDISCYTFLIDLVVLTEMGENSEQLMQFVCYRILLSWPVFSFGFLLNYELLITSGQLVRIWNFLVSSETWRNDYQRWPSMSRWWQNALM